MSHRLVPCTFRPSRDLSPLSLLDRYPSPESSVTKISLELVQRGPWKHSSIVLQCTGHVIRVAGKMGLLDRSLQGVGDGVHIMGHLRSQ